MPDHLANPLRAITGAWHMTVPRHNRRAGIVTPASHLVHLVLNGTYTMRINDTPCAPHSGDLIYYAPADRVDWLDNERPVSFYSIAFDAPIWQRHPRAPRLLHSCSHLEPHARRLVETFARAPAATLRDTCRIIGDMLIIWDHLLRSETPAPAADTRTDLWWRAEAFVRAQQDWRMPLDALATHLQCSRSTLHRACRSATRQSPAARLRQLRLQLARDLLRTSPLTITAIAEQLGYPRVQEFSREFTHQTGHPPSHLR